MAVMNAATTERFGDALRRARQREQLTQKAAAKRLGISSPTYVRWEKGSHRPRESAFDEIADFMGVSVRDVSDLLTDHDPGDRFLELASRIQRIEEHLGLDPL